MLTPDMKRIVEEQRPTIGIVKKLESHRTAHPFYKSSGMMTVGRVGDDTAAPLTCFLATSVLYGFARRRRYPMISHKMVAPEIPLNRDAIADCGHQGPMSQQNTYGFSRNELYPQKLVGCGDLNARKHEAKIAFS